MACCSYGEHTPPAQIARIVTHYPRKSIRGNAFEFATWKHEAPCMTHMARRDSPDKSVATHNIDVLICLRERPDPVCTYISLAPTSRGCWRIEFHIVEASGLGLGLTYAWRSWMQGARDGVPSCCDRPRSPGFSEENQKPPSSVSVIKEDNERAGTADGR